MEIVKLVAIVSALCLIFVSCSTPRAVCHDRLTQNEGAACREFLLGYWALTSAGRDNNAAVLALPAVATCLLVERERQKCDNEPNIPWFGI